MEFWLFDISQNVSFSFITKKKENPCFFGLFVLSTIPTYVKVPRALQLI